METNSGEDLNQAGTEEEEVVFHNKGQENGGIYEYYNNYLSNKSDIFASMACAGRTARLTILEMN